jgi:hypothetical protein
MENEKQPESIFEQENYQGGFGSGPLAAAREEDDEISDTEEEGDGDEELDIDP